MEGSSKHSFHKTFMPFKEVSSILADTKDSYSNNPYEPFQLLIGYTCGFDPNTEFSLPFGTEPSKVKVPATLTYIKSLHAQWIMDLYNHMREEKGTFINGLKSAGVTEAIQSAQEIVTKVENPLHE